MIFVDTNYFLRFLLNDNSAQHDIAKKLISNGAAGKYQLGASVVVVFEIYWVLSSYYKKNKTEITNTLSNILDLEFIYLPERDILRNALALFTKNNISLEDCYNIFYAKVIKAVDFKTFDLELANTIKKM